METPPPVPTVKNSNLAIWSLVLGILGLLLLLVCIGPLFAIPGVICGHMAYGRIKRSGGMLTGEGLALAGLITGYLCLVAATFVIPMLAAIAIPNFILARDTAQRNACINHLKVIDDAKQQWALEHKKYGYEVPTGKDLDPYITGGFASLHCPKDGAYTIGSVATAPTCSTPGHALPYSAIRGQRGYTDPGNTFSPRLYFAPSNQSPFGPFNGRTNFHFSPLTSHPSSNQIAEMRASQEKTACNINLFMIKNAKRTWASFNHKPATAIPTEDDLLPFLPGSKLPVCPSGGNYTLGALDEEPTCSIPEHALPHLENNPAVPSPK